MPLTLHPTSRDSTLAALENLIHVNFRCAAHFRQSAREAPTAELRRVFEEMAEGHDDQAIDAQSLLLREGGDVVPEQTPSDLFRILGRTFIHFVYGHDASRLITEMIHEEGQVIHHYKQALTTFTDKRGWNDIEIQLEQSHATRRQLLTLLSELEPR